MAQSKARTNDWVKLANAAVVARDHLRARHECIKLLGAALNDENARTPRSGHVWVSKQALLSMLTTYNEVGQMLSRALKERDAR
jgi:hypothetical protein